MRSTAGTDASTPWMRAILAASAAPIAVLFVARVPLAGARPAAAPAVPVAAQPVAEGRR